MRGDDDDDGSEGGNPPELVEGRMEDIALFGYRERCQRHSNRGCEHRERLFCCYYQYRRILFEFDQIQVVSVPERSLGSEIQQVWLF